MPTMLDLAEVAVPRGHKLDGISLSKLLLRGQPLPERTLFWAHTNRFAVRQGPWKLLVNQPGAEAGKGKAKTSAGQGVALYQLTDDLGEKTNLAAQHPGRVKQLETALAAWRLDVAAH